ncbi:Uncharacterised protein [Mycobacteroides abscessus subsp. abscessus]|nr:Uncharacterised protein [Mycobacteroides abscessus subsp. abscessus]
MCRPPVGERTIVSQPCTSPSRRAARIASKPLTPCTSTSTTETPEARPVGMPMFAAGNLRHQASTCAGSVVASWKPRRVIGCLPSGAHGNTGTPDCANTIAARPSGQDASICRTARVNLLSDITAPAPTRPQRPAPAPATAPLADRACPAVGSSGPGRRVPARAVCRRAPGSCRGRRGC